MRKLIFLVSIGLWQLTLSAGPMQDTDQSQVEADNSTQASPESSQSDADESDDLIAAEITETNEVEEESSVRFIPTEEISQDLGVSFPIDI